MKKYYLVYTRKSSESDERQVQSLEDQSRENNELIKRLNLPILKRFEESKSAKQPGRLEFDRMTDLALERKDIKGIVAWHFNRLSRNPIDTGKLQWMLQKGVIDEIVTMERTFKSEDSAILVSLEGGMANQYILDLRKASMRGVHFKVEQGIAPILAPPGFINDKTKPQGKRDILPDPKTFPLMRKLFELYMTRDFSVSGLTREASKMGLKNSLGREIGKSQMYRILRDPFYAGRFIYEGKIHKGIHERMLKDEEYELVQEILEDNGKSRPQKPLEFTLSGLVRCGECGMAICGERHIKRYKNGKSKEFRYYRCTKKSKTKICNQLYISANALEKQVADFLETVEVDPDFATWAAEWCKYLTNEDRKFRESKLRAIKDSYDGAASKIEGLVDLKLSSGMPEEVYRSKMDRLIAERDQAKVALDNFDMGNDEWDDLTVKTFDFASKARQRFIEGDLSTKRLVLRGIGSYLTLSGKKLDIQPRIPFLKIKDFLDSRYSTSKRLEPGDNVIFTAQTHDHYAPQNNWGG
ncbi:MAG: recombinase family protein [Candidatus Microgenomates bacterium]